MQQDGLQKNIVAAGLADKCELELAYAIGLQNQFQSWLIHLEQVNALMKKSLNWLEKTSI